MNAGRHFLFIVCTAATLLAGCSKGTEPQPTIDGKWTYTTSDGKIKVNFELTTNSSGGVDIKNPAAITVNGVSGAAAAQIILVKTLPSVLDITINANDAALIYPHTITFTSCKFVSTSNSIEVIIGSYVIFPAGNTVNFSAVSIVRQ